MDGTKKLAIALVVAAAFFAALGAFGLSQLSKGGGPALPVLGEVPAFTFTERDGEPYGTDDLRGGVWIANFVFTRCPGPCPVLSSKMAGLQSDLADLPEIRLVTFTVDPSHDTPEVLTEYAARYNADPERWVFLRGKGADLGRVVTDGFKLLVQKRGKNTPIDADHPGPILHSTRFALVGPDMKIRGYYDSRAEDFRARIAADARALAESADGVG